MKTSEYNAKKQKNKKTIKIPIYTLILKENTYILKLFFYIVRILLKNDI